MIYDNMFIVYTMRVEFSTWQKQIRKLVCLLQPKKKNKLFSRGLTKAIQGALSIEGELPAFSGSSKNGGKTKEEKRPMSFFEAFLWVLS